MTTDFRPLHKPAETAYPIHELLADRWSPRVFDPERSIPRGDLLSVFEAARWAPSSRNEQPWRFLVATRDDPEEFQRMLACLKESNQAWAQHASALALSFARTHFTGRGTPNRHAWHDVGLAVAALTVEALARDIYVHQMGGILPEVIHETYAIPEGFEVVTGLALGYRGDLDAADSDLRERDLQGRSRRPLGETLFSGGWGEDFQTKN